MEMRRPPLSWLAVIGAALIGIVVVTVRLGRGAEEALPVPENADVERRIQAASIPPDAAAFPLVASVDAAAVVEQKADMGLVDHTTTFRAKLGDVIIQWQQDQCVGGSACISARNALHDVSVGSEDSFRRAVLGDGVICEAGTDNGRRIEPSGCPATAFALRQAAGSDVRIVMYRDKALLAFTRR